MNFLTRFSLKNPAAIIISALLLMVGGLYAFTTLKVDMLPNIELPTLTVQSVYPGASPADVDDRVTQKLEQSLKSLSGIKKLTSQSLESFSLVQLEFPIGTDMDSTTRQVESSLQDVKLPEGVTPKVTRFSFGSLPILNIALFPKDAGSGSIESIVDKDIRPELEKIEGVSSISIGGMKHSFIEISVDPEKAKANNITLNQISQKVQGLFVSMPAGSAIQNNIIIPIRVEQRAAGIADLKQLSFDVQAGFPPVPSTILLSDIAAIKAVEDSEELVRYNEKSSLALSVSKKQDANTVQIADKVLATLDKYQDRLSYSLAFDQAAGIKKSVDSLRNEGLFGALFASLAVLLFLRNLRATFIAIISIPLSLLIASIALAKMGITLNIMTLGGMAVAVGRVVDDSIVVIENIYRRMSQRQAGQDRTGIALEASKEMMSAITSSTLTTIVVFLPLGFVGGITGEFFLPFALTVVFALAASLLVAVTVVPILSKGAFGKLRAAVEERESALQRLYARVLEAGLKRKGTVIVGSLVILGASLFLVPQLGFIFLPNEKQQVVAAGFKLPPATQLEKTNQVSQEIEKMLLQQPEIFEYVFTSIGGLDYMSGMKQANQAQYMMSINPKVDVDTVIKTLSVQLDAIVKKASPEATVTVQEMSSGGPPTGNNVNVQLYGSDMDKLGEAAKKVEDHLKQNMDLQYIQNNFREKQRQWIVRIDPQKAAEAGIDPMMVLGLVADRTKPVTVGTYTLDGKTQEIRAAYAQGLTDASDLENIALFGKKGRVLIKDIAAVQAVDTLSSIQRLDGKIYAEVSAQIRSDNVANTTKAVQDSVAKLALPEGISLTSGGGSEETEQTFKELGLAIAAAIGLVYLVMLVSFGKARIPIVILSSLLFIPVGAIAGLYFTRQPLSVSAMIGLLMLVGIVVTNAIVLIDRVSQNRQSGMKIRKALIEAGTTRLRPILMTAFATVCALVPLALTESEGSLISKGLAVVVIGGLVTATLLTLVIVPIMYELFFHRERRRELRNIER
ncbi:efflux RND transporter permease subunit [Paenibacillus cremeus]|uniref:Efflux RND transporter permease subunit n=1 Tax=Paenibacillus cremeus TaxID=2163881 RepID=A0A559KIC5_9BACL|nr:efflux RND transporter permease subunit [Paenibacillus cremeus]TVY11881.1 efflux RND transporter permease subunit [Paenibacillus cremeus]